MPVILEVNWLRRNNVPVGRTPLFAHKYEGIEAVEVWGNFRCGDGWTLNAREIGLETIQELILTPEARYVSASKWIVDPGKKDNYATIWLYDHNRPGALVGSVWVNFHALGESG